MIVLVAVAGLGASLALVRCGGRPTALPPQDRPGTVVLIPGYGGSTSSLNLLADALHHIGRTTMVVSLPDGGTGDLRRQADTVDGYVAKALRAGAPSVDVVGYSAGGVVARLWARDHDGTHKARRIVTLGSPHHGADVAAAGAAALPDACPTACQQLAPGSTLLAGLSGPVTSPPQWMSVWTDQDQTVTPPDSARLDGAVLNVVVQSVCPGRPVTHSQLPADAAVTTIVEGALGAGPMGIPPHRAACVSS